MYVALCVCVCMYKVESKGSYWYVEAGSHYLQYVGSAVTNLHTPWSRVLLDKLTSTQLVKKFPAFYGT